MVYVDQKTLMKRSLLKHYLNDINIDEISAVFLCKKPLNIQLFQNTICQKFFWSLMWRKCKEKTNIFMFFQSNQNLNNTKDYKMIKTCLWRLHGIKSKLFLKPVDTRILLFSVGHKSLLTLEKWSYKKFSAKCWSKKPIDTRIMYKLVF